MIPIDAKVMLEIAPRFSGKMAARQAEIVQAISPVLGSTLEAYEIDTRLRIAHFLGQTCHESAGFRTTEEFASGDAYEGRKDLATSRRATEDVARDAVSSNLPAGRITRLSVRRSASTLKAIHFRRLSRRSH